MGRVLGLRGDGVGAGRTEWESVAVKGGKEEGGMKFTLDNGKVVDEFDFDWFDLPKEPGRQCTVVLTTKAKESKDDLFQILFREKPITQ